MDNRTRTALEGSIAKWERIVEGTGEDNGSANCPLCVEFTQQIQKCAGCPVAEWSKEVLCFDTPYETWLSTYKSIMIENNEDHYSGLPFPPINTRSKEQQDGLRALAQAELYFLRSLLPSSEST